LLSIFSGKKKKKNFSCKEKILVKWRFLKQTQKKSKAQRTGVEMVDVRAIVRQFRNIPRPIDLLQNINVMKNKKDKRDLCAKFCVTSKRYNYTLKQ